MCGYRYGNVRFCSACWLVMASLSCHAHTPCYMNMNFSKFQCIIVQTGVFCVEQYSSPITVKWQVIPVYSWGLLVITLSYTCSPCQHYTLHTAHPALCTLHTENCTLHTAHCTLNNEHCTLHAENNTLHTGYCSLHSPQCTLHTAHCTLYTRAA